MKRLAAKWFAALLGALLILISASGCGLCAQSVGRLAAAAGEIVDAISRTRLTDGRELMGERRWGEDSFTGEYMAGCQGFTGQEIIFGGFGEKKTLHISGFVRARSGRAAVRVHTGDRIQELALSRDGSFSADIPLQRGGDYIEVIYSRFHGRIELVSEYRE